MLFNSISFLIFLPIVLFMYFIVPKKIKKMWLLLASYFFYMCWNAGYAVLILTSTVITYGCGIFLEKVKGLEIEEEAKTKRKKLVLALCIVVNLAILFFFKYFNFTMSIVEGLSGLLHIDFTAPQLDVLLPVGISFYTFQAIGYTIDVYRDDIYAEKNFITYALFVSFFPQLVAGPIERSKNLLKQLNADHTFDLENFKEGLLLMMWGFFLKIVLADRMAVFVDTIFFNYNDYPGFFCVVAVILVVVQIYCDFYGYSLIAMGSAKMLDVTLMENFDAPLLARNIPELWRRWHISLTSWFVDYLYKPLGGSRKGKLRRYLNIMIIFLVSGLWHGASWNYIIWGGTNGVYQIIGYQMKGLKEKLVSFFNVNVDCFGHKLLKTAVTYMLFALSVIPVRAKNVYDSWRILKEFFTARNPWILFDGSLYTCGLDNKNFAVMMLSVLALFIADMCKYHKIAIRKIILKQDWWARCLVIVVGILIIMIFGKWGPSFDNKNFMYFQF